MLQGINWLQRHWAAHQSVSCDCRGYCAHLGAPRCLAMFFSAARTYLYAHTPVRNISAKAYGAKDPKFPSAGTMIIATSAWEAPVIMFLMKSRCPGASITV